MAMPDELVTVRKSALGKKPQEKTVFFCFVFPQRGHELVWHSHQLFARDLEQPENLCRAQTHKNQRHAFCLK